MNFTGRMKNKSRDIVLVFGCGFVPGSHGIWRLECHLFTNVSEVAQHHNAAPSTQIRERFHPSSQTLKVAMVPAPTRLAYRDVKLTLTGSFYSWLGS